MTKGMVLQARCAIPAEVSGWTLYETPPDVLERARRTFDLEEHLAGVREIERTGGFRLEDILGEIEDRIKRRE
jgi:hypothetical protein